MSDEIIKLSKISGSNTGRAGNENLPATEFRHAIPEWDTEAVHLRDYLDVIFRRKWIIISFLALTFITTLILTLASPKMYKASTFIEVMPQNQKVTKFEEVVATEMRAQEFYQTQVDLLQNKALTCRVIERLELVKHPVIMDTLYENGKLGIISRIRAFVKNNLSALISSRADKEKNSSFISEEALKQEALIKFVENNLEVSPKRNSMLIGISFMSPDRQLSQSIANAFVEEFVHWNMEKKLEASQLAREFLMKQIDRAKISLEKAEEDLNRFGKQAGIVSLDAKLNSVYRQLEELNSALAMAETDLIGKESVYKQAMLDGPSSLPQVMENQVISGLKAEYARLRSEYEDLTVTFHDGYPAVKALKTKMDSIADRINIEEQKVFLAIANQYKAGLQKVETMQERLEHQKKMAIDLNERATQYKIMAREVETNKGIYQSLLERTKEIESMVGVSSSNIHIVDKAMLPIKPFKPRVKLNLLLALVVGVMGGLGLAFFLEYFTDTITDPDEISDRFHIPILGVAPLSKTDEFPVEHTFVKDPRAPLSEAMRSTKMSIQLSGTASQAGSFVLTSTRPSEGKTTMAANLALAFAGAGERVILVDADMRKPKLHKFFQCSDNAFSPGLSKFLAGVSSKGLVCQNGISNVCFIPAGPIPPNPVELLASERFAMLIQTLTMRFDRVIVDGPPYLGFADSLVISRHMGGVVLVSSMGETTRDALLHFKKSVLNSQGKILGCIINKVNLSKRFGYQSYYKYYSYYSYGKTKINKKKSRELPE
ncbi:MAG: polysaccharide biosynthesis tyrosine autokinase [Deltaproteobacteria bacterium]|nr:polysaccharide biosynthesis tyrosine autokinase [Deltaproteobacteria bacterium]MBW2012348.1 polysaccharide biosynthesis tyrosine autokinase [Deltaproteobacteria bacterium]